MNIHHLELLHHVATHGGISKALRHMPYGIQQPAVSAQLIRLEKDLGVRLFQRKPFALTPAGEELFAYARPFFSRLDEMEALLRDGTRHLRIAASETVIRHHLPGPLKQLKTSFPELCFTLSSLGEANALDLLSKGELDIVIGPETCGIPGGITVEPLIEVRIALFAPLSLGNATATSILKTHAGKHPLITLPNSERMCQIFHEQLERDGLRWKAAWELSGLDLIQRYVELGFGIGLTVQDAFTGIDDKYRFIPLERFPRLKIQAFHRGLSDKPTSHLLQSIRDGAKRLRRQK